jgi:rare lipoprotein A
MIKIMRGIVILAGIVLIFLVITACTTDSVFAKKNKPGQTSNENYNTNEKEEYFFDDGTDDESEYAVKGKGKKDIKNTGKDNKSYSISDDQPEYNSYYQKGFASWYGREFHGRKTASGEKYDMNKLTAAHKELPFGTKIYVKNLENGKEVSVVVNDRGPYKNSRILDLSYAAAKKIGIIGSGEAKVGIRIVKSRNENNFNNTESTDDIEAVSGRGMENIAEKDSGEKYSDHERQDGNFSIQAGAFYSRRNAEKFQKQLERLVDNPVVLVSDRDMYKVRIDKITNKKDAGKVKKMLEDEDISSYIVENNK